MDSQKKARIRRDVIVELEKERAMVDRLAQPGCLHDSEVAYNYRLKAEALAKAIEYLKGVKP